MNTWADTDIESHKGICFARQPVVVYLCGKSARCMCENDIEHARKVCRKLVCSQQKPRVQSLWFNY